MQLASCKFFCFYSKFAPAASQPDGQKSCTIARCPVDTVHGDSTDLTFGRRKALCCTILVDLKLALSFKLKLQVGVSSSTENFVV